MRPYSAAIERAIQAGDELVEALKELDRDHGFYRGQVVVIGVLVSNLHQLRRNAEMQALAGDQGDPDDNPGRLYE